MDPVKVSVENLQDQSKSLHVIDKGKSLEENIKSVCELFNKVRIYISRKILLNDRYQYQFPKHHQFI